MEEADEVGRFATGMDVVVQNLKTVERVHKNKKDGKAKPKQKSKQTKGKQLDGTGQEPAITKTAITKTAITKTPGRVGKGNHLSLQTKTMILAVHSKVVAKIIIVNRKVQPRKIGRSNSDTEITAFLTGVSVRTVKNVLAESRAGPAAGPAGLSEPSPRGPVPMDEGEKVRKVTLLNPDLMPTLRRLIEWEHTQHRAVSCKKLVKMLKVGFSMNAKEDAKFEFEVIETKIATVRRVLKIMGYVFGVGSKVHYLKETPGNVKYRGEYVKRRIANRRVPGPGTVKTGREVKKLEIFIDESYCNVNHGFRYTWYEQGKSIPGRTGVGQRANILGALAIGDLDEKTKICEMVTGSLAIWHGNDHSRGTYTCHGPRMEKALKEHVNLQVLEPTDYHGNVTADLFEDWLRDLCDLLNAKYGVQCIIYLDGAKSHKRILEGHEQPTGGWNKKQLTDWLLVHAPDCGVVNKDPRQMDDQGRRGWSKDQMLVLAMQVKAGIPKRYKVCEIARENGGHEIQWTPPYHPELQPIERVWACVKNQIAHDPVLTTKQLLERLFKNFQLPKADETGGCLSKEVMQMTHRKTRVHEDLYTESANKVAMEKATALEVSLEVSGDPDDDVSHTQSPDEPADDADEDEADM